MGPQFTFLGVTAADQHKARRVAHAQTLALDHVFPGRGHVNQQINQVVLQQIDLVDVQVTPIGAGQQARFKRFDALRQGALQVQGTHHAVFSGAQGQVDHRYADQLAWRRLATGLGQAIGAARRSGVAAVAATGDHAHFGQQCSQRPYSSRLTGATVTQYQHTADAGVDGGQNNGQFHVVLADDGGKRKGQSHGVIREK